MMSTPPLKRAQMNYQPILFAIGGHAMPKAKPVSLFPLSFEQAIGALIKAPSKPQEKRATSKPKKRKKYRRLQMNQFPSCISSVRILTKKSDLLRNHCPYLPTALDISMPCSSTNSRLSAVGLSGSLLIFSSNALNFVMILLSSPQCR
jgi:hypothetical protein